MDGIAARALNRQETRGKVRDLIAAQIDKEYGHLDRKKRRELVRTATSTILKQYPGQRMVVTYKPKNWWQRLKAKGPAWFKSRFPVKVVEV